MKLKHILWLLMFGEMAVCSPQLDSQYALRIFVPIMTNRDRDPVYSDHVEALIADYFSSQTNTELSETGMVFLKKALKGKSFPEIGKASREKLTPLLPTLKELSTMGVHGAIVTEVQGSEEGFQLLFMLVSTANGELLNHVSTPVDNRYSLDSFTHATKLAITNLMKGIPFHGSVLKREGYRVVLDKGAADVQVGMQISSYTIELKDGKPSLEETGTIVITQAESQLSFGKIVVERKPFEIVTGNKILIPDVPLFSDLSLLPPPFDREDKLVFRQPASIMPLRRLGHVDVNLGASVVTMNNMTTVGSTLTTGDVLYPGGGVKAELWMSRRAFFDFGIRFGMRSLQSATGISQNSNVNDIRGQMGYRLGFSEEALAPTLHIKGGLARQQFQIDTTSDSNSLVTTTYSGFLLGAGARFPLDEKFGMGFDVNGLIFPSLEESPLVSGKELKNISSWDFALNGTYELYPSIDLECQLHFQGSNAEFSGPGTRGVSIVSTSQATRTLMLGINYYF